MPAMSVPRRTLVAAVLSAGLVLGGSVPAADAAAVKGPKHCAAGKHVVRRHGKRVCIKRRHRISSPTKAVAQPQPQPESQPDVVPSENVQLPEDVQLPENVQPEAQGAQGAAESLPPELASLELPFPTGGPRASARAYSTIGGYNEAGTSWFCNDWFAYGAYYYDWCAQKHISSDTGFTVYTDYYLYYWNAGWVWLATYRCQTAGGCSRLA